MDKLDFNIITSTEKEQSLLEDKLVRLNRLSLGLDPDKSAGAPLNFVMKEGKEIIAGINAESYFCNVLHIKILFVFYTDVTVVEKLSGAHKAIRFV